MAEKDETTILEEGNVKITNLRVVVGSNTYEMSNILSVSLIKKEEGLEPGCVYLLLVCVGIVLTLITRNFDNFNICIGVSFILVIVIIWGLLAFRFGVKTSYTVKIRNALGEINIIGSQDETYIKRIVDAMNDAITHKG